MPQVTLAEALAIAIRHHQAGQLEEAERIYRQILVIQPSHADAAHLLGVVAAQTGRTKIAVEFLARAIADNPNVAHYHLNYAHALRQEGQLDQAIAAYRRAIALGPADASLLTHFGNAMREAGQLAEAQAALEAALRLGPNSADAHTDFGLVLAERKQFDLAIARHRQALRLSPDHDSAHNNLALALMANDQLDDAIAEFECALRIKSDHKTWNNLGNALEKKGRLPAAINAYRQALRIKPDSCEVLANWATALHEDGQFRQAVALYRRILTIDPHLASAHWKLGVLLLLLGEFEEGLDEYEWRWRWKDFPSAAFQYAQPRWDGGELKGRTILLHAEQGFGDVIQFIRYAPLVAGRGGRVIVASPPELSRLIGSVPGVAEVVPLKTLPSFDVHCPVGSLPRVFSTRVDSIPAGFAYLSPAPALVDLWRTRIGPPDRRLRVGLAWAGRATTRIERRRALMLSQLAPLAKVSGVAFYSLQKSEARLPEDAAGDFPLIDYTADFHDFADTAAFIANLDLVISIDTAAAHLGGALGRTWVMLPLRADWRWLLDRDDSPWYPNMRLFRQTSAGDWAGVVERVAGALGEFVAGRA